MSFVEQYRKICLIVIIIILGLAIFEEMIPFIGGLLGAMTIYVLIRNQMRYLVIKKRMKRVYAAMLLLLETILCFLIPMAIVVFVLIDKVGTINIDLQEVIQPVENFAAFIENRTGYNLLETENFNSLLAQIPKIGQHLVNGISGFVINVIVLLFVLYFMLIGGGKMEQYIREILPFGEENKKLVLHETNIIVKSNAIGIPLLAIIQGIIAGLGYYIFDVPSAVFFGFLTCIATIIPLVGTAIIWIPLIVYLAIAGEWGNAIGLLAYGLLVITQVDNLVRFILQKQMADIHPLITIFGVIIGLPLFGFMGVIFGPLLLSIFFLCFNIFKKEYLDKNN